MKANGYEQKTVRPTIQGTNLRKSMRLRNQTAKVSRQIVRKKSILIWPLQASTTQDRMHLRILILNGRALPKPIN